MERHFDLDGALWEPKWSSAQAINRRATPGPDTLPPHQVMTIFKLENVEELPSSISDRDAKVMDVILNFIDAWPFQLAKT